MTSMDTRLSGIIDWIGRTTDVASGRGVLVPISGGSDSALCFWLCTKALPPGRAIAAYAGTDLRCREWFEQLGPVRLLPQPLPREHVEAHRWALMLTVALSVRGWLVGTRNRTEDVLGTFSLASRVATYLPLVGLWKSEVMELAEAVGVPREILQSSRRADPSCGRPQEMADIPFATVDLFLQVRVGERPELDLAGLSPAVLSYLSSVYQRNRFKSGLPMRPPSSGSGRDGPPLV
jgi:NH3-dependent NAD+ synthetase